MMDELPIYLSAPHACSYLDDREARTVFTDPQGPMNMATYAHLARLGFRRSGDMVYRQQCESCAACVSLRVPAARFVPRRRHRRCLARNADLAYADYPLEFRAAHFALYRKYTAGRHPEGGMADADERRYMEFLGAQWSDTRMLEFRLGDAPVCVAVTDRFNDGLSAVYTFFDPDLADRSLGTYAILRQLALAEETGLPYLYLGYWIKDCRKMRYKRDFEPAEGFIGNRWVKLADQR